MTVLLNCPRCKQRCLDLSNCGESALYGSLHLICVPCWHKEDAEIDKEGTNDLPVVLTGYGPQNDYGYDDA